MRKSMALQKEIGPSLDITFDCEDGASAGNEANHASLIADLIGSEDNLFGRIGIRVHDVHSPFFEGDVATICARAAKKLAYIMVPKIEGIKDARIAVDRILAHAAAGGRPDLPVHFLIETHGALHEVWQIAAIPEVESLSFGLMDFVSAHYGAIPSSAMRSPGQFTHPLVARAKLEIAAACHAYGKVPSHCVTTDITNSHTVASDANIAAAQFGYTRMWSIHPSQIRPIIANLSPGTEEIEKAAAILVAAQQQQWGPIQHHGQLHDRASYRYYWKILQRAHTVGMHLPVAARTLLTT